MYRAEFFTDSMTYQSAALFDTDELAFDYLTLDATTLTLAGKLTTQKGSFAHITNGSSVFDGVVSDVQPGDGVTDVSIRPLQALFDFDTFVPTGGITDVAAFLTSAIESQLISSADTLQNKPITLTCTTTAKSRPIAAQSIVNVAELMAAALTTYRIAVNCKLDMQTKRVAVCIEEVTATATLEADLPNVMEKEITLGDSYGSYNKTLVRKVHTDKETGAVTYLGTTPFYLHPNGTVTTQDENRITPVFFTVAELEDSDTWDIEALEKATELLTPQQYDNELVLTYAATDSLANPLHMQIGTTATVYIGGSVYTSILTGKTYRETTVQLLFGSVRVDLTKKLILERRKRK